MRAGRLGLIAALVVWLVAASVTSAFWIAPHLPITWTPGTYLVVEGVWKAVPVLVVVGAVRWRRSRSEQLPPLP